VLVDDRKGSEQSDADLVARASRGDRTAFGMLYLRHHLAAWRMASVASGFSDDAEVDVIDGFTNVFSSVPTTPPERERPAESDGEIFRRHLLVCVRRIALDRIFPRRHPVVDPAGGPDSIAALQAALRSVPEPARTVMWLAVVEGWAAGEVALTLGLEPHAVPALRAEAIRSLQRGRRPFRRSARTGGGPEIGPALVAAVPPVPALGGECQRRWLRERAMHSTLAATSRLA